MEEGAHFGLVAFSVRGKRFASVTKDGQSQLPPAIGGPATRVLLGAGLTTLAQVATRSESELLALRGVGPKAVRILGEALARNGMSLR